MGIIGFLLPVFLLVCYRVVIAAGQAPNYDPESYNPTGTMTPSMGILVGILFFAFILTGFLSMYIRWCGGYSFSYAGAGASFLPVVLLDGRNGGAVGPASKGVDESVIKRLPTFVYSAVKQIKAGGVPLECAVCLNEFEDKEVLRLLPKCNHVFHPACIDAWLVNHTTCPVCRSNLVRDVEESESSALDSEAEVEVPEQECVIRIESRTRENRGIEEENRVFSRSNSTGRIVLGSRRENSDRFTLRLPEEVRKQAVARAKLKRAASLPRLLSSRRGYRVGGGGEGSLGRSSWFFGRSDRWVTRAASFKWVTESGGRDITAEEGSGKGMTPSELMAEDWRRSLQIGLPV